MDHDANDCSRGVREVENKIKREAKLKVETLTSQARSTEKLGFVFLQREKNTDLT